MTDAPGCRCGRRMFITSNDGTCLACGHGEVQAVTSIEIPRPTARTSYPAIPAIGSPPDRRPWTHRMVVAAIRRWARETGRPPRSLEWGCAGPWWPSSHVVVKLFGTWKDAIRAAGFEPPAAGRPSLRSAA